MTLEEALKIIRGICENCQATKAQHDSIQNALKIVEDKCLLPDGNKD